MSIKSELIHAGVRVAGGQLIKGVKDVLKRVMPSKKSKKMMEGPTATGIVTTAVGFGAAALTGNPVVGAVAQEARVLGMAGAAGGVIDAALGRSEKDKDKDSEEKSETEQKS